MAPLRAWGQKEASPIIQQRIPRLGGQSRRQPLSDDDVVGDGGRDDDGQFGGGVSLAALVPLLVQVKTDEGFAGDGRLVLFHQQPAGAGRRRPVDTTRRIAPLVVTHAHHPGRVLKQVRAGGQRDLWGARGQAQFLEGDHPGINDDILRRHLRHGATRKAQQIAGLHHQRADGIVAPLAAVERVGKVVSLARAQADHFAMEGRRKKLHRQRLVHLQPGNGQPAGVLHRQIHRHPVAEEGAVHKTPLGAQMFHRAPRPEAR